MFYACSTCESRDKLQRMRWPEDRPILRARGISGGSVSEGGERPAELSMSGASPIAFRLVPSVARKRVEHQRRFPSTKTRKRIWAGFGAPMAHHGDIDNQYRLIDHRNWTFCLLPGTQWP
jgi:hypothetical protein